MSTTGRRWLEMTVRCPSAGDRSALLADGLLSLGARAVEERGGWYVSYFAEPEDVDAFVSEARAVLTIETGFERIEVEHGWQADDAGLSPPHRRCRAGAGTACSTSGPGRASSRSQRHASVRTR